MIDTLINSIFEGNSTLPSLDVIIRTTAILGLAGIIALCLHNATSATRHLIWTAALVAILILPVFYFAGPSFKLAVLPASTMTPDRPLPPPSPATPAKLPVVIPDVPTHPPIQLEESATKPGSTISERQTTTSVSDMPEAGVFSFTSISKDISPSTALLFLWTFGVAVIGLRLLVAHIGLMLLSRSASVVTDPVSNNIMFDLMEDLDIRRDVTLKSTRRNVPPLTWGVLRPVIILPVLGDLDDEQKLRSVLLHELAHIKRLDWFTQLLGQITCTAYWFNPLTWYAHSRQQIEQEMACDDAVIEAGTAPGNYATNLLDILRGSRVQALPAYASTAMARKSSFEGRLIAILDPERRRIELNPFKKVATLMLMGMLTLPLVAVRPVPVTEQPSPVSVASGPEYSAIESLLLPAMPQDLSASETIPDTTVTSPQIDTIRPDDESPIRTAVDQNPDSASLPEQQVDEVDSAPIDTTKMRAMIVALQDEDAEIRRLAARILGEIGHADAIPALTNIIRNDPDQSVRVSATRALGEIGNQSAFPALMHSLKDVHAEVRWSAAWALGELGNDNAVPVLADALGDEDRNVRLQAARSLGELESEQALQALINALDDTSPEVRLHAARAIADIGSKDAVPALIRALDDENDEVRLHVVRALGDLEDRSSTAAVVKLRTDPNAEVRAHVALSLGELDAEMSEVVPALVTMLDDESEFVRYNAVHSLGEIEDPATLPAVGKIVTSDPSPQVRMMATRALSEYDSPDVVPFLRTALRDSDLNVQRSAARALGEFDDVSVAGELIQALNSEDDELRANSAYALGELRSEDAIPALIPLLDDESNEVRINAIRALGSIRIENEVVTGKLMQILENDPDRNVRREAARALSEL